MKFAAFALVLLASLFSSLSHGMAAAPGCVEVLSNELAMLSTAGAAADGKAGNDRLPSPDDAHCGFGMLVPERPWLVERDAPRARIGGHLAELLLGRDRMPDERPPDAAKA